MSELDVPKSDGKDFIYNLIKGGTKAVGGLVASEIFGLIVSAPISKRREKWMLAVVAKLKEFEKSSPGFIESLKQNEPFISFLLESSQIALKTHQVEKLEVLQNTIRNFFIYESVDFDKKESYLRIIDEISPTHFKILNFIKDSKHL